jgi:hypothetical protein
MTRTWIEPRYKLMIFSYSISPWHLMQMLFARRPVSISAILLVVIKEISHILINFSKPVLGQHIQRGYDRLLKNSESTAVCWTRILFYTVGRTPRTGDQPIARPLPTHRATQTQNKCTQRSMLWVGFEPTIPGFERAKTVHTLVRAATVIEKRK